VVDTPSRYFDQTEFFLVATFVGKSRPTAAEINEGMGCSHAAQESWSLAVLQWDEGIQKKIEKSHCEIADASSRP
jgi:hypothetical protein